MIKKKKGKTATVTRNDGGKRALPGGWLWVLLPVLLTACQSLSSRRAGGAAAGSGEKLQAWRYNEAEIAKARQMVKDGDLILRTGNDFTSLTLRQFSMRDPTYSHAGIAVVDKGKVYVFHSIGGEDNPDEKLRKDPFETFCDPRSNLGIGIYRYDFSPAARHRLDSIVGRYWREGILFDMHFDLKTDNRMYCSEFVYKSVIRATGDPGYLPVSHLHNFTFISTDDLFLNGHAREICRIRFH